MNRLLDALYRQLVIAEERRDLVAIILLRQRILRATWG